MLGAAPSWYRSGGSWWTGATVGRWALVVAVATLLLAVARVAVAKWLPGRRARAVVAAVVILSATGVVVALRGSGVFVAVAGVEAVRDLPEIPDLRFGFRWVCLVCAVTVVGIILGARRDGLDGWRLRSTASVAVLTAVCVAAVGMVGIARTKPGPAASASTAMYASSGPSGIFRVVRVDPSPASGGKISAVVPVTGGVAVAADRVLRAYGPEGRTLWTVEFPSAVSYAVGPDLRYERDGPWLLVQTASKGPVTLTYGIEAATGRIAWSSDAFGKLVSAAGGRTYGNDWRWVFAALVSASRFEDTGLIVGTDLVMIDAATGTPTSSRQFRAAGDGTQPWKADCRVPTDVHLTRKASQALAMVVQGCGGTDDSRLLTFALDSGEPVEDTAVSTGIADERPVILDTSGEVRVIGVVDAGGLALRSEVTGTLTAPSAPDGYVITAVLKADFYSYTVLAVRRDRRLVVMDVGYPTQSTVLRVTDLGLEVPRLSYPSLQQNVDYGGMLVPVNHGALTNSWLTAAGYRDPHPVSGSVPQTAPLTVVSLSAQGADVSMVASPCRQGESPRNRVLAFGGGTALWCSSSADFSNELFLLS